LVYPFLMNIDGLVAPPPPRTMTREWQEATNARLKELGIEPISGPGAEDYKVGSTYTSLTVKGRGVIHGDFTNRKSHAVAHEEDEEE
jgi:hypothetical protein